MISMKLNGLVSGSSPLRPGTPVLRFGRVGRPSSCHTPLSHETLSRGSARRDFPAAFSSTGACVANGRRNKENRFRETGAVARGSGTAGGPLAAGRFLLVAFLLGPLSFCWRERWDEDIELAEEEEEEEESSRSLFLDLTAVVLPLIWVRALC